MSKSPITCHVLDSSLGKPAAGVKVVLSEQTENGTFLAVSSSCLTDSDGRCMQLWPVPDAGQTREDRAKLTAGKLYKVTFHPRPYFESKGRECFYPWVEITFQVLNPNEHYHIPLLISPYSYTTYRGS